MRRKYEHRERKDEEFEEQKQEMYQRSASLAYENNNLLHSFVCEATHPDIIPLCFIYFHADGMITSDIIFVLWADYMEAKKSRRKC